MRRRREFLLAIPRALNFFAPTLDVERAFRLLPLLLRSLRSDRDVLTGDKFGVFILTSPELFKTDEEEEDDFKGERRRGDEVVDCDSGLEYTRSS